ncbi:MAG: class I SAM-dependent methyltransferase [Chitinophagaceae bacterium]|nr:MAG: class I SAM-dependent methyltransferase [Chitinophagaceae bacterium]
MSEYIIAGGEAGKQRLALLGSILNEGTLALLRRLQPAGVERFLDLGCGGGSVALDVARSGFAKNVVGIDADATVLELARADAAAQGVARVEFRQADAEQWNEAAPYDLVYTRFVLSHMTHPQRVLQKAVDALRPGGLLLAEDVDFPGHFCYPANKAFHDYLDWYQQSARRNGQDPVIGPRLPSLLHASGLAACGFDIVQPAFQQGPGKWMAWQTLDKIGATLLRQHFITEDELATTLAALKVFTEDPQSIISLPRIFRAWGRKDH